MPKTIPSRQKSKTKDLNFLEQISALSFTVLISADLGRVRGELNGNRTGIYSCFQSIFLW